MCALKCEIWSGRAWQNRVGSAIWMHNRCKQHMALWWKIIKRPKLSILSNQPLALRAKVWYDARRRHEIRQNREPVTWKPDFSLTGFDLDFLDWSLPIFPRAPQTTSAGFAQHLQILSILEHQAPKKQRTWVEGFSSPLQSHLRGYIGWTSPIETTVHFILQNLPYRSISPSMVVFFGGRVSNFWVSNCSTREYGLMLKRIKHGPLAVKKTNRRKKTCLETWASFSSRHKPYHCFK